MFPGIVNGEHFVFFQVGDPPEYFLGDWRWPDAPMPSVQDTQDNELAAMRAHYIRLAKERALEYINETVSSDTREMRQDDSMQGEFADEIRDFLHRVRLAVVDYIGAVNAADLDHIHEPAVVWPTLSVNQDALYDKVVDLATMQDLATKRVAARAEIARLEDIDGPTGQSLVNSVQAALTGLTNATTLAAAKPHWITLAGRVLDLATEERNTARDLARLIALVAGPPR
jgi:hypothetical protein